MRAVVQRVSRASVHVNGEIVGAIGAGVLVLLGVGHADTEADARYVAEKVAHLRIFEDDDGKMNRSLLDSGGAALIVSQFTLHGDVRRGRRPSLAAAAPPAQAEALYEACCRELAALGVPVQTGQFQAMMDVELVNDGPVTILVDSERVF